MNWPGFISQGRAPRIVGGGVLAGVAGIVLSQTLLSPTYEVLYSGGVTASHCAGVEGRQACSFVYEFSVGNTGKSEQEHLRIEWPLNMQRWYSGWRVTDIVASTKRTHEPRIGTGFEPGRTVYTIDGLMPNTVVDFTLRCMACTPGDLHAVRQVSATVVARGAVSEADPRVSALQHGVMNVLRVVGLFG